MRKWLTVVIIGMVVVTAGLAGAADRQVSTLNPVPASLNVVPYLTPQGDIAVTVSYQFASDFSTYSGYYLPVFMNGIEVFVIAEATFGSEVQVWFATRDGGGNPVWNYSHSAATSSWMLPGYYYGPFMPILAPASIFQGMTGTENVILGPKALLDVLPETQPDSQGRVFSNYIVHVVFQPIDYAMGFPGDGTLHLDNYEGGYSLADDGFGFSKIGQLITLQQ